MSELFKDYFSSVYSNYTPDLSNFNTSLNDVVDLSNIQISLSDIFLELGDLKSNFNLGPDGVFEILLISCKYALAVPIHIIFN